MRENLVLASLGILAACATWFAWEQVQAVRDEQAPNFNIQRLPTTGATTAAADHAHGTTVRRASMERQLDPLQDSTAVGGSSLEHGSSPNVALSNADQTAHPTDELPTLTDRPITLSEAPEATTQTEQAEKPSEHVESQLPDLGRLPSTEPLHRWWIAQMGVPVISHQQPHAIRLDEMVLSALNCSKQIRAAQLDPFIEQETVTQLDAQFDWNAFVNTLWTDTDEPTASELDAGENQNRLLQEELTTDFGLRRTNRVGGQFEVNQNTRARNSNSDFFNDAEQGISRLTLRYNQPLLKNGGWLVNEGQVLLAQLNADAVQGDAEAQILDVIIQVVEAYWNLYRVRAEFHIRQTLVSAIEELLEEIKRRERIDAQLALVAEVESQLSTQRAQLGGARIKILQAQHQLVRQLGNRHLDGMELIPGDVPFVGPNAWDVQACFATALQHRSELRAALRRIASAELSLGIAQRQLLPQLAWILEANVAGINNNFDIPRSLGDQFSEQGPTYSTGFSFQYPLGNRAARSQARQAELTLARNTALFEDTVDQIRQELRDAIAVLDGLGGQVSSRELAVRQANTEIESLRLRRQFYPEEFDQITQLYLRELLDALLRRALFEQALVDVEVDRSTAILQLRRAVGTLLVHGAGACASPPR